VPSASPKRHGPHPTRPRDARGGVGGAVSFLRVRPMELEVYRADDERSRSPVEDLLIGSLQF